MIPARIADWMRILMLFFGVILIFVLARAGKEAREHDELDAGQQKRMWALILLAIADIFGGIHNLGHDGYWTLPTAALGLVLAWWGALDLRREQRRKRGPH